MDTAFGTALALARHAYATTPVLRDYRSAIGATVAYTLQRQRMARLGDMHIHVGAVVPASTFKRLRVHIPVHRPPCTRTHTHTHLRVGSRMWVLRASAPIEGFPTLSRRLPTSWNLHMDPISMSSANPNKTPGNLIPGSAKKKSAKQKQHPISAPPLPPRSNVGCN